MEILAKYTEHRNTSLLHVWDERNEVLKLLCYTSFSLLHPLKNLPFHKQNIKYFRNLQAMKRTNFNCLWSPSRVYYLLYQFAGSLWVSPSSTHKTRLLSFGTIEILIIRRGDLISKEGDTMRWARICKLCDRRYCAFFFLFIYRLSRTLSWTLVDNRREFAGECIGWDVMVNKAFERIRPTRDDAGWINDFALFQSWMVKPLISLQLVNGIECSVWKRL